MEPRSKVASGDAPVTDGHRSERKEARTLLRKIAEGTHICGDPGMQFDTTITNGTPAKGPAGKIRPIRAANIYFLDNTACNLRR